MVSLAKQPPLSTDFEHWLASLNFYSKDQLEHIAAAHDIALKLDSDLSIGLSAADMLADLHLDADAIIAALLHQAVHYKAVSLTAIAQQFGQGAATLTEGLERLNAIGALHSRGLHKPAQLEGLRNMLLAIARDLRVVLIKLALHVCTMRNCRRLPAAQQMDLAHETLDIFAPLANRLGMGQFKWELEDLALRTIDPDNYKAIAKALHERRRDREQYIEIVLQQLRDAMAEEKIRADISGRVKHIYSIWRKMQRKRLPFEQIFDVRAVRVIVDTKADCYSALGIVHTLWKNIPQEFDDYIANPKGNGYQSLHTAVYGPQNKALEVQIRTTEMHQSAELGVAAHWKYKEESKTRDESFERQIAWLRNLLDFKDDEEPDELLDQFKAEVFQNRVFVLTPQGDIIDMMQGATPLDFAYLIHTEIGHRCRGAKVNDRIVPLHYELQNGDQVEILTTKISAPNPNWLRPDLGYLRTTRARAKVRHWLRQQDRAKAQQVGMHILEQEFQRLAVKARQENLAKLTKKFKYARPEELYIALGLGNIDTSTLANALQEQILPQVSQPSKEFVPVSKTTTKDKTGIQIQGVGNLLTTIANCCKPVPPEAIVGYITRSRGIVIHRHDCPNLLNLENYRQERIIDVDWGVDTKHHQVDIMLDVFDRPGILNDITAVLGNEEINAVSVNTRTNSRNSIKHIVMGIQISDMEQLSRLLDKLSNLRNVLKVQRHTH